MAEKARQASGKANYEKLHFTREAFHKHFLKDPFPTVPRYGCKLARCMSGELLGCCHHDLEEVLRVSGRYFAFLKKRRNFWHQDQF